MFTQLHEVKTMARAMKLDEAADQVNARAIKAAFEPFLNDPDEEIVAQTKQFDADEKAKAVQKYSDDITAILKGVEAEAKVGPPSKAMVPVLSCKAELELCGSACTIMPDLHAQKLCHIILALICYSTSWQLLKSFTKAELPPKRGK